MHHGLQHSCDVYFYEISRKVGIDNIAAMARQFGLGEEVGIDLNGERGGVIPTRDWKLANIGEPWQGGETLVASIGQGFVLTTPRSEERRVGKEWVRTCKFRWAPDQ